MLPPPTFLHFQRSRGSVLIVVMLVCIGLVSLTLVFANSMALAYRGEDNNLAGQQAEQAVEAGARYAEYLFSQVDREGGMPDPDDFQSDWLTVGDATFWFIGEPSSATTQSSGSNQPVFGLVDEASKINLNTASTTVLQGLPGVTSDLATAIVNWRSAVSGSNSSSSVIQTGSNKYAPFESVEELALLVSGTGCIDLLYGADTNANHVLDGLEQNQAPSSNTTSGSNSNISQFGNGLTPGLTEFLTVFSQEPNTLSDGTTQRVNVTKSGTANSTALNTFLTNNLGSSRSTEIINKLRTTGTANSLLAFYIRGGLTETEFEQISPQLTAKSGTYVKGLVNANTASVTVLACIPGIGAAKAVQLVAAREQQTDEPVSLAWVVPILGNTDAITAGPYLTANTYQLSVDVAAVGRNGRGYRRTRFVIDKSTGIARIVYRRNLTTLGWALGSDIRQQLAMKTETR